MRLEKKGETLVIVIEELLLSKPFHMKSKQLVGTPNDMYELAANEGVLQGNLVDLVYVPAVGVWTQEAPNYDLREKRTVKFSFTEGGYEFVN
jgi:hypothetical protein